MSDITCECGAPVEEARARAKAMPWAAKVRRGPTLCRGWWMFAGVS